MTLEVILYQDASSVQDSSQVDDMREIITVEKGYLQTQIEYLNSLQTNISQLNDRIDDLMNKLTYVSVSLAALAVVFAGTSIWLATRKRKTYETTPKPNAPHNPTQ